MTDRIFTSLLLFVIIMSATHVSGAGHDVLKEHYFLSKIEDERVLPEERLRWCDSLDRLSGFDKTTVGLKRLYLLGEAGRSKEALALADELLKNSDKLTPDRRLKLLYSRSLKLGDNWRLAEAINQLQKIHQMPKPDSLRHWDIIALGAIATNEIELKDFEHASMALDKMQRLLDSSRPSPEFKRDASGRIHGLRGQLLQSMGREDSAFVEYHKALGLVTEHAALKAAYIQLGDLYLTRGDVDAAMPYIDKAMAINTEGPNQEAAAQLKATALMMNHRYADALKILDSYPQGVWKRGSLSNYSQYLKLRGTCLRGLGQLDSACVYFERATEVRDSLLDVVSGYQKENVKSHIDTLVRADRAEDTVVILSRWIVALAVLAVLLCCTGAVLLMAYHRQRRRSLGQIQMVEQARHESLRSRMAKMRSREMADELNRRQTSLLFKLAQLENGLGEVQRKLQKENFGREDRRELISLLQRIGARENMWNLFAAQFEMTNSRFLGLLAERHPDLTKSEKRICAFMLMNMSTKEIAALLNRSPHTIDVTKYNLRKKLNVEMPTEDYLQSIAAEANRI